MALIITLFLDNTIPGTLQERGLHVWTRLDAAHQKWWDNQELYAVRPMHPCTALMLFMPALFMVQPPLKCTSINRNTSESG